MKGKVAFHSLGCRVNIYETSVMETCMREAGYEIAAFAPGADIYVINTCTVTNIADRKSRQMLHRAKEMNPGAVVVAVGCYVEDAGEALLADPAVDIVIGNADKGRLPEILAAFFEQMQSWEEGGCAAEALTEENLCLTNAQTILPETEHGAFARNDEKNRSTNAEIALSENTHRAFVGSNVKINAVQEYEELPFRAEGEHTRAFVKIQDGCNQFCSYCMIPYVRGRVRSRQPENIALEAKALADAGYREIVITGIHVSSYGLDFAYPGENRQTPFASEAATNERLLEVLRSVAKIEGVRRVRMGSLEPGIVTESFAKALAEIPEFCPSFHLSLQSGCDATLRRMRRKYTTADYEQACACLRRYFSDASIATDVIAGFPGETDGEFEETLAFVKKIHFARMHIFKYSARRGTVAARMGGQVPEKVKAARAKMLAEVDEAERSAFARRFLGRECEALLEEKRGEEFTGYTKEYVPTRLWCPEGKPGEIRSFIPEKEQDGTLMTGYCSRFDTMPL
ncbi:MAG: tRNA (N(6)-L-threonylcarbamoyladenosine(37)-C(2))-methylthiotransferase MtaB [Lachnospiraceae bacterium]